MYLGRDLCHVAEVHRGNASRNIGSHEGVVSPEGMTHEAAPPEQGAAPSGFAF